jgi:hypothetical protein
MHFRTLEELEQMMSGHQAAFEQLGVISREESFNVCFADWLHRTKDVSAAAGWACAIKTLLHAESDDSEALFAEVVQEFLSRWDDQAGDSETAN